ncbi:MAG: hypothetical protein C4586_04255 [Anaerolineaceae bacterium]|nr:MAG: hypothetical protein C4586_04255 [Anaerolineaceae bacterium]
MAYHHSRAAGKQAEADLVEQPDPRAAQGIEVVYMVSFENRPFDSVVLNFSVSLGQGDIDRLEKGRARLVACCAVAIRLSSVYMVNDRLQLGGQLTVHGNVQAFLPEEQQHIFELRDPDHVIFAGVDQGEKAIHVGIECFQNLIPGEELTLYQVKEAQFDVPGGIGCMADGAFHKIEVGLLLRQPIVELVRIVALQAEGVFPLGDRCAFEPLYVMVFMTGITRDVDAFPLGLSMNTIHVGLALCFMAAAAVHGGE